MKDVEFIQKVENEDGRGYEYTAIDDGGGVFLASTNYDEHGSVGIDAVDNAIARLAGLFNVEIKENKDE